MIMSVIWLNTLKGRNSWITYNVLNTPFKKCPYMDLNYLSFYGNQHFLWGTRIAKSCTFVEAVPYMGNISLIFVWLAKNHSLLKIKLRNQPVFEKKIPEILEKIKHVLVNGLFIFLLSNLYNFVIACVSVPVIEHEPVTAGVLFIFTHILC